MQTQAAGTPAGSSQPDADGGAGAPSTDDRGVTRRGLRLIRRYVRGQPVPFTFAVVGATLFALAAVGTTVVLGRITDDVLIPAFREGVTRDQVLGAVAALLAVTVLRASSIVLRRYSGAMTGRRTQAGLRRQIADRYLDVPLEYHHRTPTGRLLAHADSDVEAATEMIYPLPFSVGVIALIFFSVVSLLLIDPWLTLVAMVLFPALAVLNRVYTSRVEEPAGRAQEQVGRVATVAHESIDGALVVKVLGRQADELERLHVEADALRRARIDVGRLRAAFEPTLDALPNIGIVALLAMGAWEIDAGALSPGELVQAMALFGLLAFPMRVVGFFLEELPRSVVSIERIDGVLAEPTAPEGGSARLATEGPVALAVDDLSFAYDPDTPVLDHLSFTVEPGETVAVVGSTGSGKSTLFQLLAGLLRPASGQVRLDGVPLDDLDTDVRRDAVALVFQESFLFADTVRDNLTLGVDVPDDEVAAATHLARADAFIARLPRGEDTVMGERGVTLSGGQRQRVALARALLRRPRLLLLDDATSAVDPTVEAQILAGLEAELPCTALVVAHRVSTIELADRVVFIDGGRVVASGPHARLRATVPAYEAIVSAYEADEGDVVDEDHLIDELPGPAGAGEAGP